MAKTVRIKVERNPEQLLKLAEMVYARHQELGASSPLAPLDWVVVGPTIVQTLKLHLEAEELKRKWEQKYRERDALLEPIDELVKQSRDLLKALYKKEPKKLGEFGYTVDDTPRVKKEVK
jgi:cell division protein ZapA (FtsZ GTPase activity inhibitor)